MTYLLLISGTPTYLRNGFSYKILRVRVCAAFDVTFANLLWFLVVIIMNLMCLLRYRRYISAMHLSAFVRIQRRITPVTAATDLPLDHTRTAQLSAWSLPVTE